MPSTDDFPKRPPPRTKIEGARPLDTDAELIFRFVHDGDHEAFSDLVKAHFPLVYGVCHQILQSDTDAQDACQGTFIILARKGSQVRNANSLASWLYRVAYRISCGIRKQTRETAASNLDQQSIDDDDVLSQICRRETLSILHEELYRLPANYRDVILLHHLERHTREETAALLETTDASVKARLARGRRLLRSRLMRRGVAFSVAMTTACKSYACDAQSAQIAAANVTSLLSSSGGSRVVASHCELLANQEMRRMYLSSLTRPMAALASVVCLLLLLGIGQEGTAETDAPSSFRLDLASAPEHVEKTRHAAETTVDLVPSQEIVSDEAPRQSKGNWMYGGKVLVVQTQTVVAAYSVLRSTWDRVELSAPLPKNKLLLGDDVVAFQTRDAVYAFSAMTGTWGRLRLPENTEAEVSINSDLILAEFDGTLYAFGHHADAWSGISLVTGEFAQLPADDQ